MTDGLNDVLFEFTVLANLFLLVVVQVIRHTYRLFYRIIMYHFLLQKHKLLQDSCICLQIIKHCVHHML